MNTPTFGVQGNLDPAQRVLGRARLLTAEQAEFHTLWWPVGGPGTQVAYLQLALRRLHGLIEGEPTPWLDDPLRAGP